MSASEKLRALDEAMLDARKRQLHDGSGFFAQEHLRSALPQIVEVVEAADALPEFFTTDDGRVHSFGPLLAALDEALT